MANSKTEIMKVFSLLSPDNQRTVLLCARTAKVAEEAARGLSRHLTKNCQEEVVTCRL